MAGKRLFAVDMSGSMETLGQVPTGKVWSYTISFCNRTGLPVGVKLAMAAAATPTAAEWLCYELEVPPNGTIERTGLVTGGDLYVVGQSVGVGISAVGYGFER